MSGKVWKKGDNSVWPVSKSFRRIQLDVLCKTTAQMIRFSVSNLVSAVTVLKWSTFLKLIHTSVFLHLLALTYLVNIYIMITSLNTVTLAFLCLSLWDFC